MHATCRITLGQQKISSIFLLEERKQFCLGFNPNQLDYWLIQLKFFVKCVINVLTMMYGEMDTSILTKNHTPLNEQNSEIVISYIFNWLLTTTLATLVIMNLLIGLAIGDIRAIDENADCMIVQIELKKLFRRIMRRNLRRCICKCFGITCRKGKTVANSSKTIYPNQSKSTLVIENKTKDGLLSSESFILGGLPVKKAILDNYK